MGGVGVRFLESHYIGIVLAVIGVDAGAARIEKALHSNVTGSHQEMGVDEHTDHAQGPVELDEPHPPHVAGEVVNFIASLHHPVAGLFFLKIQNMILGVFMNLIPLIQALDIGDHHLVA